MLKKGDKVRVRTDLVLDEEYGLDSYVDDMQDFAGELVTLNKETDYGWDVLESIYNFTPEMFEPKEVGEGIGTETKTKVVPALRSELELSSTGLMLFVPAPGSKWDDDNELYIVSEDTVALVLTGIRSKDLTDAKPGIKVESGITGISDENLIKLRDILNSYISDESFQMALNKVIRDCSTTGRYTLNSHV